MARPRYVGGSVHEFHVRRDLGSRSLVRYAAARLSLPASWISHLLDGGCIRVDGTVYDRSVETVILREGSVLTVTFPPHWPPHMRPTEMPLSILYEDEDLLVLDKPPGIVVHPARGHMDCTSLQNGVLHYCRGRLGQEGVSIGPSHRLDKDTSGVIVYALTTRAHRALVEQFATRHPHKEYLAVVEGDPLFEQTEAAYPLGQHPDDPSRITVVPEYEGGKPSRTSLYVLERGTGWALVRANPLTGRPHQVRVHCAKLGLPIMGDRDYNPRWRDHAILRQALHAAALVFEHPVRLERMRVEAPLPEDMATLLEGLRVT